MECGAPPDDDAPSMPFDSPFNDLYEPEEEEVEPPDISHEGGEIGDAANAVYIHIVG